MNITLVRSTLKVIRRLALGLGIAAGLAAGSPAIAAGQGGGGGLWRRHGRWPGGRWPHGWAAATWAVGVSAEADYGWGWWRLGGYGGSLPRPARVRCSAMASAMAIPATAMVYRLRSPIRGLRLWFAATYAPGYSSGTGYIYPGSYATSTYSNNGYVASPSSGFAYSSAYGIVPFGAAHQGPSGPCHFPAWESMSNRLATRQAGILRWPASTPALQPTHRPAGRRYHHFGERLPDPRPREPRLDHQPPRPHRSHHHECPEGRDRAGHHGQRHAPLAFPAFARASGLSNRLFLLQA